VEFKASQATLEKLDSQDNTPLPDAKFLLSYMSQTHGKQLHYQGSDQNGIALWTPNRDDAQILVTDSLGKINVTGLPHGKYFFEEIEAPPGYKLPKNASDIVFDVDTTDTDAALVQAANDPNAQPKCDIKLRKVDSNNYQVCLPGAQFALYGCKLAHSQTAQHTPQADPNETENCWQQLQKATSDTYGNLTFTALASGEYRLVETTAPTGYRTPSGQWQIVIDAATATVSGKYLNPATNWELNVASDGETLLIPNDEMWELPGTGGAGYAFPVGGIVLTAIIAVTGGLAFYIARMRVWQNRRVQAYLARQNSSA
jgi:hypothetical protein